VNWNYRFKYEKGSQQQKEVLQIFELKRNVRVGSDLHGGKGGVEAKRRDSELVPGLDSATEEE